MSENTKQLALIGRFSQFKDVRAYEESKQRVRIIYENETIPGKYFEIVEDMDYEIEKVNGYCDHERKEPGYTDSYITGMEIVAKPQE
jgi:hypothetical protein